MDNVNEDGITDGNIDLLVNVEEPADMFNKEGTVNGKNDGVTDGNEDCSTNYNEDGSLRHVPRKEWIYIYLLLCLYKRKCEIQRICAGWICCSDNDSCGD